MELEDARDDLIVAVAVAVCTIALSLVVRVAPIPDPGVLVRLAPIGVYLGYLFTRKGGPYTTLDTTRNWVIVAVVVTLGTLGYAVWT